MDQKLLELTNKKERLDRFRPLPSDLIINLEEWFKIELTYTSNAIEGNTLTRNETALVIEKGLTVEGKSLKEHLEATNHAEALELVKKLAAKKRNRITQNDLLAIHRLILQKTDESHAGRYRTIAVRIAGARVVLPNPNKVPSLMKEFIKWLQEKTREHPVKVAAVAHFQLVSIHPFIDGNGRTARLLMNLILRQSGYPPALIKKEERRDYINAIEKGQLEGELEDYYGLIYRAVGRSLDIYLEALEMKEKKTNPSLGKLLKIGDLAKKTGEPVSAIRYWTKVGLLGVKSYTQGGYQLYGPEMIERVKKIRLWQDKNRLMISEIKDKLV